MESDVVVPVEVASDKPEYAARTIRKKLMGKFQRYLWDVRRTRVGKSSLPLHIKADVDLTRWERELDGMQIDRSVSKVDRFKAGPNAARKRLKRFLRSDLKGYANARIDPADPQCSMLSPYLHFGQISPVEIARACQSANKATQEDRDAFLEELIVRRELAINFVYLHRRL